MFQLLHSIWMLGAAGIIIPVIIHFWNRKEGKTLKVGSISLLTKSSRQQAKSLQLQELLLLLLRCTLIILVALLLSGPVWQEQLAFNKEKGWVLMEKQGLPQTYARFKPVVDSLIQQQYEFHYFDAGFEKNDLETALKSTADTLSRNSFSYWSLLSSLDQLVPATLPVYLFTGNSLQRFTGNRPQVAMNLQWHTSTAADSVSAWLAGAYATPADSIRLITATSQPSGTAYAVKQASFAAQTSGEYSIKTDNNHTTVSFKNSEPVTVDTATLSVTLFTNKYYNDLAYLKAAIESIQLFSKRKISILAVNHEADIPGQQNWLFWLSDQPVSTAAANNVFVYEKGKPAAVTSYIQPENNATDEGSPALHKRIVIEPDIAKNLQAIWEDGFGDPLLALEKSKASVYHFYSRIDPSWNDLPWSSVFPQLMYDLLVNNRHATSSYDTRIIDERQLQPVLEAKDAVVVKDKFTKTRDLAMAFWVAAFIIFCMERYISLRSKNESTYA